MRGRRDEHDNRRTVAQLNCLWDVGELADGLRRWRCVRCRYTRDLPSHISSFRRVCGQCKHVGDPSGVVTIVAICREKRRRMRLRKHACAVHGECLPIYTCQKDALSETSTEPLPQPCSTCPDYQAQAQPQP